MKYTLRLKLAARELARELRALRADRDSSKLAIAIYEARLTAVTQARQKWTAWLNAHPESTLQERRAAKYALGLPVTRSECLQQIERIHREVLERFEA
jgi:hypothetical protein